MDCTGSRDCTGCIGSMGYSHYSTESEGTGMAKRTDCSCSGCKPQLTAAIECYIES